MKLFDTSFTEHDCIRRARHGQIWSSNELRALEKLFSEGADLEEMCDKLKRPADGVVIKLAYIGCIRAVPGSRDEFECLMPRSTPTTDEAQPRAEENTMSTTPVIETKVLIKGREATDVTDREIFAEIARLEGEMAKLQAIKNKPKKLEEALSAMQADIDKLIAFVDAR